jgi:hypothetical protein
LALHALREFHFETGRDQPDFLRSEDEIRLRGPDVVSGRMGCGSGRERQILVLRKSLEPDDVAQGG